MEILTKQKGKSRTYGQLDQARAIPSCHEKNVTYEEGMTEAITIVLFREKARAWFFFKWKELSKPPEAIHETGDKVLKQRRLSIYKNMIYKNMLVETFHS